jgi:hypothetical protein
MALNPVFNFFENAPEQQLYEDLIIESIQMYGYDMMYIPRRINSYNVTLNEDAASYFDTFYTLEMYIKSFDGFTGDSTFLSKFNVEVRNEITFTVAKRRFNSVIGIPESVSRPKEGDLLWLRMDKKLFVIKKVEHYNVFYQTGILQTWDLSCEPYEYEGEHFRTGIDDVDAIETAYSLNTSSGALLINDQGGMLLDDQGFPLLIDYDLDDNSNDYNSDSEELNDSAADLIDFSEDNPFSEMI